MVGHRSLDRVIASACEPAKAIPNLLREGVKAALSVTASQARFSIISRRRWLVPMCRSCAPVGVGQVVIAGVVLCLPLPTTLLACRKSARVSRSPMMAAKGTRLLAMLTLPCGPDVLPRHKKALQNRPNRRMIPTRSPVGQTANVRIPLILTPRPLEPDSPRIRRVGSMAWFGNCTISRNQPESAARIVVTISHSNAKKSGRRPRNFARSSCSTRSFLRFRPLQRLYLEMAIEGKRCRMVLAVRALKLQYVECRWRHLIAQCPREDAPRRGSVRDFSGCHHSAGLSPL
jgi:hypothetical protein